MASILLSCGEPSGDLYAAALLDELGRLDPTTRAWGFGGERLERAGCELAGHYEGLTVTGLSEALRVLPRSLEVYRTLVARADRARPDLLVAIDFPDFNFRLARAMKRRGVPVVYYVSPQVWAWRRGRLKTMKAVADRVLVIFPFEETLYREAGIPVEFVGHPLLDLARAAEPRDRFLASLGLAASAPTIALLPGSRPNEVRRILPDLIRAVPLIRCHVPSAQVVIARAPSLAGELFEGAASGVSGLAVVEGRTDDVLAASDLVLTASGTATVQSAIHGVPMVVVYRLSSLTFRIGKPFVHVTTYAMVNLVAGRRVVAELIQRDFTPEAVAAEAVGLLTDRGRADRMRAELHAVREKLGTAGASARAAEAVLRVIRRS
ncbi:MAG: lipid-A-disaccharide synthase [Acidobacteria bacterium]|nr:lipid-A-disaccharide synthase [Acidobacteriota bacterium]MBI3262343.1 lipid-A-disaccharide synthase [Acidobacteriota bacterium]